MATLERVKNNIYAFSNYGTHPLCNKYISSLKMKVANDILTFNCVEQYMQYSEALFFDEFELSEAIYKKRIPSNKDG